MSDNNTLQSGTRPSSWSFSILYLINTPLRVTGHVVFILHFLCATSPNFPKTYIEHTHHYRRNLTSWAENGVLLLNTSLTVHAGEAGSHQNKGWENFTDKVIEVVDKYGGANLSSNSGQGRGIVFLAWGAWAAKRVAKLDKVSTFLSFFPLSLINFLLTPRISCHLT